MHAVPTSESVRPQDPLCSVCCRWPPAFQLTLSDTFLPLGRLRGVAATGRYRRYCCHGRGRGGGWSPTFSDQRAARPRPIERPLLLGSADRNRPVAVLRRAVLNGGSAANPVRRIRTLNSRFSTLCCHGAARPTTASTTGLRRTADRERRRREFISSACPKTASYNAELTHPTHCHSSRRQRDGRKAEHQRCASRPTRRRQEGACLRRGR